MKFDAASNDLEAVEIPLEIEGAVETGDLCWVHTPIPHWLPDYRSGRLCDVTVSDVAFNALSLSGPLMEPQVCRRKDVLLEVAAERKAELQSIALQALAAAPAPVQQVHGRILFVLRVRRLNPEDVLNESLEGAAASGDGWRGEVIHVEEDAVADGRGETLLYVSLPDGLALPTTGSFRLWPFDFLDVLEKVFSASHFHARLEHALSVVWSGEPTRSDLPIDGSVDGISRAWGHDLGYIWGPPGTGKTWSIGQQVGSLAVHAPSRRILVLAPTNSAADRATEEIESALAIKNALRQGVVLRVGQGTRLAKREHSAVLPGAISEKMEAQIAKVEAAIDSTPPEQVDNIAALKHLLRELNSGRSDPSILAFLSDLTVVTTTVYNAVKMASKGIASRFDSVVIDEAGMVSVPAASACALHSGNRLVLVGDPRQLAPIGNRQWLARGALDSLQRLSPKSLPRHVTYLQTQRRMAPQIRKFVSAYSYENTLADHDSVKERATPAGMPLEIRPGEVVILVLDAEPTLPGMGSEAGIRSAPGPGHRSRWRPATQRFLAILFESVPFLKTVEGAFISPFRAQARMARRWLKDLGADAWLSGTVHVLQGGERDFVILDTVDLTKVSAWQLAEWKRLLNVSISRGKRWVLVLTTRAELRSTARFVREFVETMRFSTGAKCSVRPVREGGRLAFEPVTVESGDPREDVRLGTLTPGSLGHQIALLKAASPVLSREQAALVHRDLGEGPYLVRGVAGSGKTIVLAHWLAQSVSKHPGRRILVLFGNPGMQSVIQEHLDRALASVGGNVSLAGVRMVHANEFLGITPEWGTDWYGARQAAASAIPARSEYDEAFIDEAQDLPPEVIQAVSRLTATVEERADRPNLRIFYDNLQAIEVREPSPGPRPSTSTTFSPKSIGIDIAGRSMVMKESFRSTRQITEFAINLLDRLDPWSTTDIRDLERIRLLVGPQGKRRVRFVQREGQAVKVEWFGRGSGSKSFEELLSALLAQLRVWLADGVRKDEMMVLLPYPKLVHAVQGAIRKADLGAIASCCMTGQSAKGKEAEVVAVYQVQDWAKTAGIWRALFVALTRARHALWVGGFEPFPYDIGNHPELRDLGAALQETTAFVNGSSNRPEPTAEDLTDSAIEFLELERGSPLTDEQIKALHESLKMAKVVSVDPIAGLAPLLAWEDSGGGRRVLLGRVSEENRRRVEAEGWTVWETE